MSKLRISAFLTKGDELSQDPYEEKAKSISPDPPVELDGKEYLT